jgi:hypothetical protein
VLIETFIKKQLRLKAHTVTKVEETDAGLLVDIAASGSKSCPGRRGNARSPRPTPGSSPSYPHGHSALSRASSRHSGGKGLLIAG